MAIVKVIWDSRHPWAEVLSGIENAIFLNYSGDSVTYKLPNNDAARKFKNYVEAFVPQAVRVEVEWDEATNQA